MLHVIFLDILPNTISKYTAEDSNSFKSIVAFDCRGISIIDFSPRNGFKCRGLESNTVFEDVNLEEKEWVEYDVKQNQPVGIYDVQHKFVTIKWTVILIEKKKKLLIKNQNLFDPFI